MHRTPITVLERNLYDLKLSMREIDSVTKKLQRTSCIERIKCKQCMKRGNDVKARWHAENAVRSSIAATNYMKTSARVDGLIHYFETALNRKSVQRNMEEITRYMHQALRVRDLKRATLLMDRFEKEFENLDVNAAAIDEATATYSLPTHNNDDINKLIQEVTNEVRMESRERTPSVDTETVNELNDTGPQI